MKKRLVGSSILLMVAIIWGVAFIAVDYALISGWQTFTILTLRGLIAGLLLLPFAIKEKFWKNKKLVLHCVIAGIFFFLGYSTQTIGQNLTSVVNSAFFTALYVIFTPFLAVLFFKSKLKKKVLLAAFLSICGIFFLSILSKGEFALHIGDLFLVLCAIFFALQIVWVDRFLRDGFNPMTASSIMLLTMGLCSMLCLPLANESIPSDLKGYSGVLFAALFSSCLCSVLQFIGQKRVKSSNASLILSLETPFACIFSVMFGFDSLSIYSLIGILLMMSSVILITTEDSKKYNFKKYKYLLIDVDDTLLDFKKSEENAFKRLITELGFEYKDIYLEKYSADNLALWKRFEKGEIEKHVIFEERMKPLFLMLGITDDPVSASYRYLNYLSEEAHLIADTFTNLKRLSKKYELYIISNGAASVQYPRIKKADIKQFFKGIFISEEIGYQKPRKEFFDYVSNNISDFDIKKAIVIGDSLSSDIKGAIDYGIDTCWFNPNKLKTDLNITYNIKSLSQVR